MASAGTFSRYLPLRCYIVIHVNEFVLTTEEYKELIHKFDLAGVEDYVLSNTRPLITLTLAQQENYQHTGNTRVAGDPDLPAHIAWPLTANGTPMTFIAQLDLSVISQQDVQQLLPDTGVLYFFMGDVDKAYHIEHKVIYAEDKTGLKRTPAPAVTVLEKEERFTSYQLQTAPSLMPPNYAYADYDELSEDESDALDDLCMHLTEGIGMIGGYPDGQHDDHYIEAAMYLVAKQKYDYLPSNARKTLLQHFNGNQQQVDDTLSDMTMLLQIDSDRQVGFTWWDAGCIHFFIQKKDLLSKQFDNTYLSLYSS
ncbi:DUF1963 domain-containing protein [Chitinophaga flava]|uniref:DUF1963 domain-containing protein n=1 Tax=Chitinophaga flava TaxID=2259036 RepID=A0A365XPM1_9BACT|nr:DUF1963 domain-containing protein [Chitinophaga flava]